MITLEKNYGINFLSEKMRPKSVVLQSRKKFQLLEKKCFRKKIYPGYLCRYDLQNGVRKFFLNKWASRY